MAARSQPRDSTFTAMKVSQLALSSHFEINMPETEPRRTRAPNRLLVVPIRRFDDGAHRCSSESQQLS